ncbi:MAG: UPF0280 family protein [Bacillota bacterium]|nr:UPF0280 family protein [Bacillota bacterium]
MRQQPKEYVERSYRSRHLGHGLRYFTVKIEQTDLAIGVDQESYSSDLLAVCRNKILALRSELEGYMKRQTLFKTSFDPVELLPLAPVHVVLMADAARKANVGPMAAVAGTVAQGVGKELQKYVKEVIVENGGDIYLNSSHERVISVFAGESQFSHRLGIKVQPQESPLGICTSSGTVGPSISLGRADAVVIKGEHAALADAVATGAANQVHAPEDVMKAVEYARVIPGVKGVLAIKEDKLAAWGDIELISIN